MIVFRLLFQTVVLALSQIWANKVRSFLTTLGVIIGVASVLAVVASVKGLENNVLAEFQKLGATRFFMDGTRPQSMRNKLSWRDVQLTIPEVEAVRDHCPSVARITPIIMGGYDVQYGEVVLESVSTTGIWPEWHEVSNRSVIKGRELSRIDLEEKRQICLINDKAVEELNLPREPQGTDVFIGGRKFRIVGVVETIEFSGMFGGGDVRTEIFIPLSTAQVLNPDAWISYAEGLLTSPDRVESAKQEVRFTLRKMRKLSGADEDTFEIQVLQQYIDQFKSMATMIQAATFGIVSISLLVGGIGIMNIMLVSVSERTREIGLRKAVGANPGVVLVQFLVEAIMLCLAGGAVGMLIGQGLVFGVKQIPGANLDAAAIPVWAVALAVGFCAATGVIFGMFPAIKAARLDPIVALRHE